MKRIWTAIGLFFLTGTAYLCAETVESLLGKSLDTLHGKENVRPLVVCFNTFTYADHGLASAFSRYLEGSLTLALRQCPQYELFARDQVERILEAQQLSLSDLSSQKDAVRIGRLKSIQAVLSGRFFDAGQSVEVFLDLTAVETGTVSGSAKAVIPKALIPAHVALRPDNYTNAVRVLGELARVETGGAAPFAVKAWTQRGDGGAYVDGENLAVHFLSNAACYIKMYHIGVDGNMTLIFPNRFQADNRILPNTVYSVPDAASGFVFKLAKPYGAEFIKIIASTEQFTTMEPSLDNLGPGSKSIITRGLSVQQREAQMAEVMLSYTILEKK